MPIVESAVGFVVIGLARKALLVIPHAAPAVAAPLEDNLQSVELCCEEEGKSETQTNENHEILWE
jgi:hypothetical protein